MSASLFDCCGYNYEPYLKTEYICGDKRFEDINVGDVLYYLDEFDTLTELVVTKPFHMAKGHCYITVKGKCKNINFGSSNTGNVFYAKHDSIAFYNNGIIGTNKESVIAKQCNIITKNIVETRKTYEYLKKKLSKIISI